MAATLLVVTAQHVQAASEFSQKTPIHIEADKMTSLEKKRAVVFSGHVKAKQGELLINSDELTVYHAEQKTPTVNAAQGQAQIQKMYAKGHVEIVQNDFVATGDEAEYFSDTGKVIIIGNAKIIQKNNMVTGYRVEMDLSKGSTVIVPDQEKKGRVVGYFYPTTADKKDEVVETGGPGDKQAPIDQEKQDGADGDTGN
ncbi:MAG: lipopolysaccharide transport periplasmic protein LptA [Proteobacteria bacterium]|nr:lipopolysaccharide transport periplasmic protein LptA [Pseudomonadota bacterium]MBU1641181.1 lipopolysaccharide transport periplasmic protein LptA [Pseudomonadota bacterium]